MSADYQALMLLSVTCSFFMYELVYSPNLVTHKVYFNLMTVSVLMVVISLRFLELPDLQVALHVFSFVALTGIYGALAECALSEYLKGSVLRVSYVAHIGIWSTLLTWSTRWLF